MAVETAAIRYAKSLLELAHNKTDLGPFYHEMKAFCRICNISKEIKILIKSPILNPQHKTKLILKLFKNKLSPISSQLIKLLEKKHRYALFCDIAEGFIKLYKEKNNIVTAHLTTAIKAPENIKEKITSNLRTKWGCKEVTFKEKIDPKIIGGYILRIGDQQIDQSLKSKFNHLKVSLNNS